MDCIVEGADAPALLSGHSRADPQIESRPAPFARSREQLRIRLYLELALVDLCVIAAAFIAAGALRLGISFHEQTFRMLGFVLPIFLAVALHNGSYSQKVLASPVAGARRAATAMVYVCALVLITFFCLKISASFSRILFATGIVASVCALVAGRLAFGTYLARAHRGQFSNKLLLVDNVDVRPEPDQIALFVDRERLEPEFDAPLRRQRIGALLQHCEVVCVACPPERRWRWAQFLKGVGTDVEFVMPELTELRPASVRFSASGETVVTSHGPLGLRERAYKRAMDLVIAAAAILLFALPMIVIAVAIRIDSPGPILFRQERLGKNNRLFHLLKFRSMCADCSDPAGDVSTRRDDPRITRLGRFIRKTSLDELPQLFNVLNGEMSIVGPRPHALGSTAEDLLFWQIDGRYFHRHAAKPGLTGLAQIRGYRGATLKRLDLTNRLAADLEYLSGWTLWRDLKIILGTFRVIMHGNAF
jgi:lipopolysaccharide/colanic/teichoic acid biosynthesis glycosyltransferase